MRKNLQKFIAACVAGEVTEGAIAGMRKTLHDRETPADDIVAVCDAIEQHTPRVSAAQMEKGRVWLLKNSLRANGEPRRNAFITGWRVAVCREAVCARLVGLEDVGTYRSVFYPIYRYETADGRYFDYSAHSWQSGLAPFESYGGESRASA